MSAPRCRPGDLAVVVEAKTPGMLGRMVVVVRPAVDGEMFGLFQYQDIEPGMAKWVIRSAVSSNKLPWLNAEDGRVEFVEERVYRDSGLRPIRPNDGEDESLSWTVDHTEHA